MNNQLTNRAPLPADYYDLVALISAALTQAPPPGFPSDPPLTAIEHAHNVIVAINHRLTPLEDR